MVCFTGSYETGRRVARSVADRLVRLQLELGGKDGAYVCDDVDVESAALAVAEGAFYNGGQSCSAIERVYVHDAIFDAFVDALVDVVGAYRTGDPDDEQTDIGPLARAAQLDVLDAQVADAVAKGARVVCGGQRIDRPGAWFEPTVLVDVDPSMSVMRDETFGPVIGVQRVRDDAEALRVPRRHRVRARRRGVLRRSRARRADPRPARRRQRVLEPLRPLERAPAVGRAAATPGLGVSMSESGVRAFVREKAWHLRRLAVLHQRAVNAVERFRPTGRRIRRRAGAGRIAIAKCCISRSLTSNGLSRSSTLRSHRSRTLVTSGNVASVNRTGDVTSHSPRGGDQLVDDRYHLTGMLRVDASLTEGLTYRPARLTEFGLAGFEPELEHLVIYRRTCAPNPAAGSPVFGQAPIRSMAASTDPRCRDRARLPRSRADAAAGRWAAPRWPAARPAFATPYRSGRGRVSRSCRRNVRPRGRRRAREACRCWR